MTNGIINAVVLCDCFFSHIRKNGYLFLSSAVIVVSSFYKFFFESAVNSNIPNDSVEHSIRIDASGIWLLLGK